MIYAGDVSPSFAYSMLHDNSSCLLVDVRTPAEWRDVGVPCLAQLGKEVLFYDIDACVSADPKNGAGRFVAALEGLMTGSDKSRQILFICRTGVRSGRATMAMAAAGYRNCRNVVPGFEGCSDASGCRGKIDGWKADGLPWRME